MNNLGIYEKQLENVNILNGKFNITFHRIFDLTLECVGFSFPNVYVPILEQNNIFNTIKHPGSKIEFGEFTLKIRLDENCISLIKLYSWMRGITGTSFDEAILQFDNENEVYNPRGNFFTDVSIIPLTGKILPSVEFNFNDCFPTSLGSLEFANITDDYSEIFYTVSFSFTDLKIKKIIPGQSGPFFDTSKT